MRNRYNELIPNVYHPQDILIKTTNYDRTIQSAYANLDSFYNHSKPFLIPIHTIDNEDSDSFRFPVENCEKYDEMMKMIKTKRRDIDINYKSTLDQLALLANVETNLTLTSSLTDRISDSIDCHWDNNLRGTLCSSRLL